MTTNAPTNDGPPDNARKLDDDELRTLSAHASEQTFQKNTVVVNEGDQSNSIFIILSGRVKVFLRNADGREMLINVLGPREYFGEMVIDEGPRSASVATLETSRFMIITKTDFKALVAADSDFALKLINRLMQRVRALTDNIRSLALLDVYGRVARLLLELATEQDGRLVVAEKLTQQDIAERVGASREMISRVFKDLITGGYISIEHKHITINRDLPERR
ncbi:MAG: Crp/Fnr family transcriptional regulator [Betaproteobacteria bacterium]|nr:Crp/Fnr family transcriptional regulator [Betaproteobacteria bacterium]